MFYLIYVIIAIAVILIFLLIVPVGVQLIYNSEINFFIKIGCFKFSIKHKEKKKISDNVNKSEKKKPEIKIRNLIAIKDEISELIGFIAGKCIIIRKFDIRIDFGCGDAAVTGLLNGGLNALVYGLMAVIHHGTVLKKWDVNIKPDFNTEKFEMFFDGICTTRPVHIIRMVIKAFKLYRKYKKL